MHCFIQDPIPCFQHIDSRHTQGLLVLSIHSRMVLMLSLTEFFELFIDQTALHLPIRRRIRDLIRVPEFDRLIAVTQVCCSSFSK